ncbi:hypothetical protein FPHOBKDP_00008 [Listeria phage LPJP1]|nr:hypothetical protein FPHOBKDP_00008 [Listeria phage LPJP1]
MNIDTKYFYTDANHNIKVRNLWNYEKFKNISLEDISKITGIFNDLNNSNFFLTSENYIIFSDIPMISHKNYYGYNKIKDNRNIIQILLANILELCFEELQEYDMFIDSSNYINNNRYISFIMHKYNKERSLISRKDAIINNYIEVDNYDNDNLMNFTYTNELVIYSYTHMYKYKNYISPSSYYIESTDIDTDDKSNIKFPTINVLYINLLSKHEVHILNRLELEFKMYIELQKNMDLSNDELYNAEFSKFIDELIKDTKRRINNKELIFPKVKKMPSNAVSIISLMKKVNSQETYKFNFQTESYDTLIIDKNINDYRIKEIYRLILTTLSLVVKYLYLTDNDNIVNNIAHYISQDSFYRIIKFDIFENMFSNTDTEIDNFINRVDININIRKIKSI